MHSVEEEDVITYGTPLVTDDDEDEIPRKKPIPIEQQVVTDERGIRRFHGAFTGGFSAGYFNTAGSKEGWVPQSFVSSRSSRAGKGGQQPEDFMDEEDLGAFGIAPRALRVNKDFAIKDSKAQNSRKRPNNALNERPITGLPPLRDLIIPATESMGVRLLRKMGWKPGQGIGPCINLKEKMKKYKPKKQSSAKIYGCSFPDDLDDNDGTAEEIQEIIFAPDDIVINGIIAKEDWHGLGYVGLDKNPILATFRDGRRRELPVVDKTRKMAITGEAFGVGVYEEDDANIYTVDDMSQYDFELGLEPSSSSAENDHKNRSQKSIGYVGKELEGFHLSSKPVPAKKMFSPPLLPRNFQSFHKLHNVEASCTEKQRSSGLDRHRMTALERVVLIDEEPPGEGSVFKHLRPEDRIRLQNMRAPETATSGVPEPSSKSEEMETFWKRFTPSSGSSSFKPFAQDDDKQKRYEIFLKLKESKKEDVFMKCQPSTMTEWGKQREHEEFRRASVIYKPLSQSMASRFVSAKQQDAILPPADSMDSLSGKPKEQEIAATIKRETVEWHPDRLLCRRFNIPNPYPESTLVGTLKVKRDKYSIFNFLTLPEQLEKSIEAAQPLTEMDERLKESQSVPTLSVPPKSNPPNLFSCLQNANSNYLTSQQSVKDARSASTFDAGKIDKSEDRPSMDLFKAIFKDTDSENDSASDEEVSDSHTPTKKISIADVLTKSILPEEKRQLSLPLKVDTTSKKSTGVFSNIDFDSLNSKVEASLSQSSVTKKLTSVAIKVLPEKSKRIDSEYYGPSLPPQIQEATGKSSSQQCLENVPRVTDVNNRYSWDSAETKTSHKHRHKKAKKKRAKHRRHHRDNSSDDEKSEEMGMEQKIINRIKNIGKPH